MADIGLIAGAVSSLKAANDIAKGMLTLRDGALIQSKVIELQSTILDAQSSVFAANQERSTLVERVGELEKQIARLEAWAAEKQHYKLAEAGPGTFAYLSKPDADRAEPPHYICANCYQRGKKSILSHHDTGIGNLLTCSGCSAKMMIAGGYKPPA